MYYRHRYYDTYAARFCQPDLLEYLDGLNLYEYTSGNPVLFLDFWGLLGYKIGDEPPPEPTWEHGRWARMNFYFLPKIGRDMLLAVKGAAFAHALVVQPFAPNTSRHLEHYLKNSGSDITIDYPQLLMDSGDARKHLIEKLRFAQRKAETSYPGLTYSRTDYSLGVILDDFDWINAILHYWTWDKYKTTCPSSPEYDYKMEWSIEFLDLYEFENDWTKGGGLMLDGEMWLLNMFGLAQHFKINGSHALVIEWKEGEWATEADIWPSPPLPVGPPGPPGGGGR